MTLYGHKSSNATTCDGDECLSAIVVAVVASSYLPEQVDEGARDLLTLRRFGLHLYLPAAARTNTPVPVRAAGQMTGDDVPRSSSVCPEQMSVVISYICHARAQLLKVDLLTRAPHLSAGNVGLGASYTSIIRPFKPEGS